MITKCRVHSPYNLPEAKPTYQLPAPPLKRLYLYGLQTTIVNFLTCNWRPFISRFYIRLFARNLKHSRHLLGRIVPQKLALTLFYSSRTRHMPVAVLLKYSQLYL